MVLESVLGLSYYSIYSGPDLHHFILMYLLYPVLGSVVVCGVAGLLLPHIKPESGWIWGFFVGIANVFVCLLVSTFVSPFPFPPEF